MSTAALIKSHLSSINLGSESHRFSKWTTTPFLCNAHCPWAHFSGNLEEHCCFISIMKQRESTINNRFQDGHKEKDYLPPLQNTVLETGHCGQHSFISTKITFS